MQLKADEKTIGYATVDDGTTSKTVYIAALPPNRYPVGYQARVKTAFAGTTSLTVEVGVDGDTTRFIRKQPIDRVGDLIPFFCDRQFVDLQATIASQQNVIATFRGADLTFLSAGEIQFVFIYAE